MISQEEIEAALKWADGIRNNSKNIVPESWYRHVECLAKEIRDKDRRYLALERLHEHCAEWLTASERAQARIRELEAEQESARFALRHCEDKHVPLGQFITERDKAYAAEAKSAELAGLISYAKILFEEVKHWRDAPNNDGFPYDTRLSVEDWIKKVEALSTEPKGENKP